MKFGIVVFPGSNCDEDCLHVAKDLLGCDAETSGTRIATSRARTSSILPGGFAYGDYLRAGRPGALLAGHGQRGGVRAQGGPVLGICNGFQVLLEAGLLPGAMQINRGLRYVCRDVHMRVENDATPFTSLYPKGSVVKMPIGHMEGNYTAPPDVLDTLEREGRVVFRYCDPRRPRHRRGQPQRRGSRHRRASATRRATSSGLMPHPDRCSEGLLGNAAGNQDVRVRGRPLSPTR